MTPIILNRNEGRALSVLGSNVFVKVSGLESGGRFALVELDDPAGMGVPPHIHGLEDETFHVLEGEFEFQVGGQKITAGPGVTAHLPRGLAHGYRTLGPGRNRALVWASPSGIETMFEELSALPPGPPDFAKVSEICGRYSIHFV
ncbi:MAG: cupin domain-containing protein [Verrucomicrobiota bacterium]